MLTRFIKTQLVIFLVASIVGVAVMVFSYMQLPTLLGLGRIHVTVELPASGGLYRFSNVTYRGVQVGKVTAVNLTEKGAEAVLTLDTSPKIPADLEAEVRSVSAVGEQYLDLRPRTDSGPFLRNGSVIAMGDTTIPQAVGPMLDQVNELVASIPKDRLSALLDETYAGLDGADYDFGSLLDSAAKVSNDANSVSPQMRALIDDAGPLLDSQAQTTDAIKTWARSLAGITDQVATNDPQIRTLLRNGPAFADETSALLNQLKPTLPILLANLSTLTQIAVTYNASLEQLLVLLPPFVSFTQSIAPGNNPTGIPNGDFSITVSDPPPCTVGFLPPSQWRSPADESIVDTPEGLYCKLPQDSPIAVRGARNYPCVEHPGKRAPTVEICDSDKPFEPLAQRQHVTGPYPFDPNLISQGVPPDDRVTLDENIYGPLQGTPLPPGGGGAPPSPLTAPIAPGPAPAESAPPAPVAPPPPPGNSLNGVPIAPGAAPPPVALPPTAPVPMGQAPGEAGFAPSAFGGNVSGGPAVSFAKYNPRTGEYVGPDGETYRQSNLVAPAKTWQDLLPK
ncbi:MCE family protein [Mycobacterium sp. WMMD1722]|uniref:MCE family protein n=1 Tax=Mycobacterium sp. WMMD1722 TaxID=3404117 RepID=UPI003BF5A212